LGVVVVGAGVVVVGAGVVVVGAGVVVVGAGVVVVGAGVVVVGAGVVVVGAVVVGAAATKLSHGVRELLSIVAFSTQQHFTSSPWYCAANNCPLAIDAKDLEYDTPYCRIRFDELCSTVHSGLPPTMLTTRLADCDPAINNAKVQIITEYAIVDVEAVRNGEK